MAGLLRSAVIGWALVATACLNTPGPASDDDDDGDAATVSCRQDARPAGQPWPPPDIDVRHAIVADIDGDGTDDVVVSVAPPTTDTPGASRVYVLYGPVSHLAPEWHAVLDLDDVAVDALIQPSGMSLDDLDGDGCLDLTLAGPPVLNRTQDRVAVWRHRRAGVPWSGLAVTRTLDWDVTGDGPVSLVWGDLGAGADRDLAIADLYRLRVLGESTLDTLGAPTEVPFDPCPSWDNVNALAIAPGVPRDRLLVFGHYRTNTVTLDDARMFHVTGDCNNNSELPTVRGYALAAIDDVPPLDLITGAAGWMGARVLSGTAEVVIPTMGVRNCTDNPRGTVQEPYIEGLAAANLDDAAAPEVVVIDHAPTEQPPASYACVLGNVTVVGDQVTKNGESDTHIVDGVLRKVVIGDLGSGPRVYMFEDNGTLHCRRFGTSTVSLLGC